jgi:hypothetical protein
MIYDYLFYKGYQLAKKSEHWDDAPILLASIIVLICAMLNFTSIIFLVEGLGRNNFQFGKFISLMNEYRYILGALLLLFIWWYYSYKVRWQRIVEKYENKEKAKGIHPVIVTVAAYMLSLIVIYFAAPFKDGDLF